IEITDSNATDSPHPARYLQYRLTLSDSETEVRRVRFFYRHTNAAPKITAIRVVTGGLGFEQFPLPPQQGSVDLEQLFRPSNNNSNSSSESRQQLRAFEKPGVVTIAWKARDPNNDQLRFCVKLRRAEDPVWKTIGDDLDAHFLSFDSNGMDEGFYQAKIIASDHLSNPIAEARTGERLSERFLIDNSAPEIEVGKIEISGKDATISISVKDEKSIITAAEYILDGSDPVSVFPEDGLFDSREETFKIELQNLSSGRRTLLFKVADEKQNLRIEPIVIEIGSL
ncbi:MAG TPA: hypothetical protein VK041_07390, partial [Opitutales bacterium]|nr:hypothetical protein [Opitutales bacterium]